jgi:hypothetical protein
VQTEVLIEVGHGCTEERARMLRVSQTPL